MRSVSRLTGTLLAVGALVLLTGPTAANAGLSAEKKCQSSIAKATGKFVQSVAKARQKCQDKLLNGKLLACPDPKETQGISKAENKATATICKACGGADKACGGAPDITPGQAGWPGTCPGFEGECTFAINDLGDIITCLGCINLKAANQLVDFVYNVAPAGGSKALLKCERTIGKNVIKFFQTKSKSLQKCWDGRIKGKHVNACPDPGDGKAQPKIDAAEAKKVASICKACGGSDKVCGGGDDIAPAAIGITICPAVGACGAISITDLASLAQCVDCVAGFKVDCVDALQTPQFQTYDPLCQGIVCGDGLVSPPFETCDGPNASGCTQACRVPGVDECTCCGDGIVQATSGETCDGEAGCRADCTSCGDGVLDPGEDCDDGNNINGDCCSSACTFEAGACAGDGNGCTDDVCDGAGSCTHPNNTASCDDGVFCNGADTCGGGNCSVHAGDPCSGGAECNLACNEGAGDCFDPSGTLCTDDGNECTIDECDGAGACVHPNQPDGTACIDDGLFCTGTESCQAGSCASSGDPCAGGAECNVSCNEGAGDCFDASGTACTDEGNECTDDQCDGAGACAHSAKANGTSCTSDGLFCTGVETCQAGICASSGDPCPGTDCNTCQEGIDSCFDASGASCTDDGNPCTDDQCDGAGGCVHSNNTASCDDGVFCNGADTCSGGSCGTHAGDPCAGGAECNVTCNEGASNCFDPSGTACTNDGIECTDDQCDGAGSCAHPNKPNGTACTDDGLFCTGTESCQNGSCTGSGDPCPGTDCNTCQEGIDSCFDASGASCTDDGNPCTDDQCDGAGMCAHPNNTASCDDGVFCNGADTCSGGSCGTHAGDPCAGGAECNVTCNEGASNCFDPSGTACTNDGIECTDDQCDGAGSCGHPNKPNLTACTDDGLFCTGTESCQNGSCTSSGDPCPGTQCNTCQEATSDCVDPSGTSCSDGDVCTPTDQCDGAGSCVGSGTTCGNGNIEGACGEQCDPPSSGSCTGGCDPDCTCTSVCGDGNVDFGEACDPPGSATCPGQTGEAPTICDGTCQCPCPTVVSFEGDPTTNALDTGWTGQSHDAKVIGDGILTVTIGSCTSPVRPCGQCDITGGPIANLEKANNQRCSNNTAVECTTDTPCFQQCLGGANDGASCTGDSDCAGATAVCAAAGTCEFFFGSSLPLSAGGVPACVVNQVNGTITGTVNVEAGSSDNKTRLKSGVFNGIVADRPCATCEGDATPFDGVRGGTCNGGARDALACDSSGQHVFFGDTSFDCPPLIGANIGNLSIILDATTGTRTKTITAASPKCTAVGFRSLKCMCSTCATVNAEACFSDADCPGGAACGTKRCIGGTQAGNACTKNSDCDSNVCGRPGEPLKPNACNGGAADCAFNSGDTDSIDEGQCQGGPFDGLCNIEDFRVCTVDSDCPASGDTCGGKLRECFTTDGTTTGDVDMKAAGSPDVPANDVSVPTLATIFCIGPTTSDAINNASGLPGPGRLTLTGTAKGF